MSRTPVVRSSFAFDLETAGLLKELASIWGVSQSEAVRRAIRTARLRETTGIPSKTPYEVLQECFESPLATGEEVARYQSDARERRKSWKKR